MSYQKNHIIFTEYGKSMFGGWYINFQVDNQFRGERKRTLKELLETVGLSRKELNQVRRFDNI